MTLLSIGVTLGGWVIAFPDRTRIHGPPNGTIFRAIREGKARMGVVPRKRWQSGHVAEGVGSESYLKRIADAWPEMELASMEWFQDNFYQSWWSQVEEVA